jgi:hypothetical protein
MRCKLNAPETGVGVGGGRPDVMDEGDGNDKSNRYVLGSKRNYLGHAFCFRSQVKSGSRSRSLCVYPNCLALHLAAKFLFIFFAKVVK